MDSDPPSPPPFMLRPFNPFKPTFLLTRRLSNINLYNNTPPGSPANMSTTRQTRRKDAPAAPVKKVIQPVVKKVKHDEYPTQEFKGDLIRFKSREVKGVKDPSKSYTFYSLILAVDPDVYNTIGQWVDEEAGGTPDYSPLYSNSKDFKGKEQVNHYITVEVDAQSIKNTDEMYFLQGLADIKSPVKLTVEAARSEFENKDGETKVKVELRLVYNTTKQALE